MFVCLLGGWVGVRLWPGLFLPVVVPSGGTGTLQLLTLIGPEEDAGFVRLLAEAVVDVGDDGEGGAGGVADAQTDPVVPERHTSTSLTLFIRDTAGPTRILFPGVSGAGQEPHLQLVKPQQVRKELQHGLEETWRKDVTDPRIPCCSKLSQQREPLRLTGTETYWHEPQV